MSMVLPNKIIGIQIRISLKLQEKKQGNYYLRIILSTKKIIDINTKKYSIFTIRHLIIKWLYYFPPPAMLLLSSNVIKLPAIYKKQNDSTG